MVAVPEAREETARLPVEEPAAEEEEGGERDAAARRQLARDRDPGAAEELERRLAADHGEHDLVLERLEPPGGAGEHHLARADLAHLGAEPEHDAARPLHPAAPLRTGTRADPVRDGPVEQLARRL